ncbi:MAG TPA: secondary thiamine-phosphate synthase enzyme YjbQ [Mesotoga sp.]|jgi:secondary thiamine-phosphate synthase enzyme|nr:secondary thiamine-phosphate synthase enzyme YjbQ [Mesotoga sp.]MDI9375930.1 secondary thiamine-phosphate synthase enzyme YjbQ [Thermotogota bacterium]NLX33534.1 YjbQ family protein [Thermotogaceae bacterium]MDD4479247.1 secondary thiamine-phosphate synthase enzyme YjbQ [Mesotoga sp.]MDD5744922.1 secondary thiamine-phosphate synthase enzyme YjbQ [Mesotoga sp.]
MVYTIKSGKRVEFIDITDLVHQSLRESRVSHGVVNVFVPHTTAGATVNENSDPNVVEDMINWLGRLVPVSEEFRHFEGNSDAHIKATLVGSSVNIPFSDSELNLGVWQAVYFCEFDGPRKRNVVISVIG